MTRKTNGTEIISFSVAPAIARDIDELSDTIGYTNRSELIRDALTLFMREARTRDTLKGCVEGVAIVLYSHAAGARVYDALHDNGNLIKSRMHADFLETSERCCDLLVLSGDSGRIRALLNRLQSLRDVGEVRTFFT